MSTRPPMHVLLTPESAWGIATLVKVPLPGQLNDEARAILMRLRTRCDAALLRMRDENLSTLPVVLQPEEAWAIDQVLHPQLGPWAADLMLQLARLRWEHEYRLPLLDEAAPDRKASEIR